MQKRVVISLLAILYSLSFLVAADEPQYPILAKYSYQKHDNPMQTVDQALAKAKTQQKRLLVVLGANWCHDSVGLARRFSSDELNSIIEQGYVPAFVDVGYLLDRRQITQKFGYATYFATPTVLIVDPDSEQLLNFDTVKQWGYADSIEMEEYIKYFSDYAKTGTDKALLLPDSKIVEFANQQAARLQAAYKVLGPLLEADEQGISNDSFVPLWREVRQFRFSLQDDLVDMTLRVNEGAGLTLPEYGPFSWEVR